MAYKTRERLIEVARQLFMHKGIENTTMNDIANASEKGRRTIYTYFKSKKEIYNAVLEHESDAIVHELKQITDSNMSYDDKLRSFLTARLGQSITTGSSYSTIRSLFKLDIRRTERIRKLVFDKESALLRKILDDGVNNGIFDPKRTNLLRKFIFRSLHGIDLNEIETTYTDDTSNMNAAFIEFIVSDITISRQA